MNEATPEAKAMATKAFKEITKKLVTISSAVGRTETPRLVAVSKTKPADMVLSVYDAGQRHFGENYVQEFIEKAPKLPSDIQWHFIGHIQSNKCNKLLSAVPNIFMIETVDGKKLAKKLDAAANAAGRSDLRILVQVNTSGEDQKSGISPDDCVELAEYIVNECPHLHFSGLMTIGKYGVEATNFFESLNQCKDTIIQHFENSGICLNLPDDKFELSMGMSGDFPLAIELGSTNIRVGSSIFGSRESKSNCK